jgi:hypothetical protein
MSPPRFRFTDSKTGAPVCPISRDQALPGMPGRYVPYVPRAVDLPSAIAAANALIQALLPQAGQSATNSGANGQGDSQSYRPGQDGPNQDGGGGLPKKKKRWEEKDRKKCRIKYYSILDAEQATGDNVQKRDRDNWIIMERITYLKFHDKVQDIDFEFYWTYNPQDRFEGNSEFISGDKGFSEYEQQRRKLFGPGGEGDD